MISRRLRRCACRRQRSMGRSRRRLRTRCICRRTSIRCSACGRIRSAPILPRLPSRKVTVGPWLTRRTFWCTPICNGLGSDTALAAIPARFALERGQWDEAAQLRVRSSEFPAARSISHFARALGTARSGNAAAARAEIAHLDEIEAELTAANDDYWAGQTRIQKQAATAWVMFSEGQRDEAIAAMRKAADLDDASEKTVAMENKLVPIRELLGELYLSAGMDKEALVEFEASDKVMPNRFRVIAAAAAATRATGSVEAAKRYYSALTALAVDADGNRPELSEGRAYLSQN